MSTKASAGRGGAGGVFEQLHDVMSLFRMKVMEASRKRAARERTAGERTAGEPAAGVAGMEFRALHFFERHAGATQQELVRHSGRDKGQIARIVKSLAQRGLLRRDPQAKRNSGLWLTEAGMRVHGQFQLHRKRLAKDSVRGLSADEQVQLSALLEKLKAALTEPG